jgi:hypothetical protein
MITTVTTSETLQNHKQKDKRMQKKNKTTIQKCAILREIRISLFYNLPSALPKFIYSSYAGCQFSLLSHHYHKAHRNFTGKLLWLSISIILCHTVHLSHRDSLLYILLIMLHIGQTGITFSARYKEHIHIIRNNSSNYRYSNHTLNTGHIYGTITDTMDVIRTGRAYI